MIEQGMRRIWPERAPLIGMVHLAALPGAPRWEGSMKAVVARAVRDAVALEAAGFDGLMIENYADVPFHAVTVPPATIASFTAAVLAIREVTSLPLGINVLRNDASGALSIAAATGARFIRVNVHTGAMWTDQGLLQGSAADTLRLRSRLDIDVAILADVHVKHATPPAGSDLGASASDTWRRGLADGLIVSGSGTGEPTNPDALRAVRTTVPEASVVVGSGVTEASVAPTLDVCDGIIVGSAVMVDGSAGAGVDETRARSFITAARG